MQEEFTVEYGIRRQDALVDITHIRIGVAKTAQKLIWLMLEKTDETPKINLSTKKPTLYKDIMSASEYFIDEDGKVLMSRMGKDTQDFDINSKFAKGTIVIPNATKDFLSDVLSSEVGDEPRTIYDFTQTKTIREIIDELSLFFQNYKLEGHEEEIEELLGICFSIKALYNRVDWGLTVSLTVEEFSLMYDAIINLYTYAFGNPRDYNLRIEQGNSLPRDPNEKILLGNVYLGYLQLDAADLESPYIPTILEKTNGGLGLNGNKRMTIYKDLKRNSCHYVNEKNEVCIPKSKRNEYVDSRTDKLYEMCSFKDVFLFTLKKGFPWPVSEKIQIMLDNIKNTLILEESGETEPTTTIREILGNEPFMFYCYEAMNGTMFKSEGDTAQYSSDFCDFVTDINIISDLSDDLSYFGFKK